MQNGSRTRWKVSLHGGHSSAYCDHARSTLVELLSAAVRAGYDTYGVTEHAPRLDDRFLYAEERALGWTTEKLQRDFESYAADLPAIAATFQGKVHVLRGFESEMVPRARYINIMERYRRDYGLDYMVGSVHHVDDMQIDGPPSAFAQAVSAFGSLERLAARYYECVREVVEALQPEVVGHLDLIRRNAPPGYSFDTPPVRAAATGALEAIREHGAIVDVNLAGYRKGLGGPYPAPWLVRLGREMGVGFCFGDDSHSVHDVGAHYDQARAYLLDLGVTAITVLRRRGTGLVTREVPL